MIKEYAGGALTPDQNEKMCRWVATEIADSLHHNNSHASVETSAKHWKRSVEVSEEFRKILPDSYKKLRHVLEANFGIQSFLYDRCADCPPLYRGEFRDHEHCQE